MTRQALRLPIDTERHAIVGTTGSGKTTFGAWCLAHRSWDRMPWCVLDLKREADLGDIPGIRSHKLGAGLPRWPGLYLVRPTIADIHDGGVTDFLYALWDREQIGLFIDEGYMIPRMDKGLQTVLTQGRSKRVPVISLSQRPAHISPFLLSESEILSTFYLPHPADVDRVNDWLPVDIDPQSLPDHHSYWYHRPRLVQRLAPCPPMPAIHEIFRERRPRGWFRWV